MATASLQTRRINTARVILCLRLRQIHAQKQQWRSLFGRRCKVYILRARHPHLLGSLIFLSLFRFSRSSLFVCCVPLSRLSFPCLSAYLLISLSLSCLYLSAYVSHFLSLSICMTVPPTYPVCLFVCLSPSHSLLVYSLSPLFFSLIHTNSSWL